MKLKVYEYQKNKLQNLNINLKTIFVLAFIVILASCSKDDPAPAVTPTPLVVVIPPSVAFEGANTTVLNIPDRTSGIGGAFGIAESTINLTQTGNIGNPNKVTLEIDMEANWIGELVIQLIAPSGESTAIIKRIGITADVGSQGDGSDFKTGQKLSFNAGFSTVMPYASLANSGFIPTGNYDTVFGLPVFTNVTTNIPEIKLATFLNNKNIQGNWKLKIYDCETMDTNKLNSWKIKFDTGALK